MLPPLVVKPVEIRRFLRALDGILKTGVGSAAV
jgi:hypothetical protein